MANLLEGEKLWKDMPCYFSQFPHPIDKFTVAVYWHLRG